MIDMIAPTPLTLKSPPVPMRGLHRASWHTHGRHIPKPINMKAGNTLGKEFIFTFDINTRFVKFNMELIAIAYVLS